MYSYLRALFIYSKLSFNSSFVLVYWFIKSNIKKHLISLLFVTLKDNILLKK